MQINNGRVAPETRRVNNVVDMEAFDLLPASVRYAMNAAAQPYSALDALKLLPFGPRVVIATIRSKDRDLVAAYRAKFGLDE